MHKLVALLPMKAHSERVKNKNFRNFAGKPLYRWMLDKLVEMPEIDIVIINTDSEELMDNYELNSIGKVKIRERRLDIRGDLVSMNKIIEDDIMSIESKLFLMTHTTNPLLSIETLRSAIQRFAQQTGFDSLFSVTKHQTRFYKSNGEPLNHDPNNLVRTQDLEPWYEENSNFYIFSKESFFHRSARIGKKPMMYETGKIESVDIDTPDDWFIAESIANFQGISE